MSGRYQLSDHPAAIQAVFRVPAVPVFEPNHDIRPTQSALIVRQSYASDASAIDPAARECVVARWGLVPPWAKDIRFGLRCINARAETIDRLPAFRVAFRHRRCLVPANAYFEWSGAPAQRIKWRIELADTPLFALAGLWERWVDGATGATLDSYAIITCKSGATLAQVHGRMPVILPVERHAQWLDGRGTLRELLVPYPAALRLTRLATRDTDELAAEAA